MPKVVDLTGKTYGLLTVTTRAGRTGPEGNGKALWKALCKCGSEYIGRSDHLRNKGHCGCIRPYITEIRKPAPVTMTAAVRIGPPTKTQAELELITARQMRVTGERWSAIASYMGVDVDTAKQLITAA